jgi:hypothetical protein
LTQDIRSLNIQMEERDVSVPTIAIVNEADHE